MSHDRTQPATQAQLRADTNWRPPNEFSPRRFLANGHLQTLVGNFAPRHCALPEPEARIIEVDPGTGPGKAGWGEAERGQADPRGKSSTASHVLCHCHWQANPGPKLTLILVHGLEGSSASQYMVGNAARAWAAGCNVVRMNMRNCGGTEHLSPTLYHSGLSGDVGAVMRALEAERGLQAFALAGYSMGGNLVLKLAGEMGESAPESLKAVVGVSPVIDLGVSADALHLPANRMYEWKFMRSLMKRFRRKAELFPTRYSTDGMGPVRTIRQFDDKITARYSGFLNADDYYYRAASARVVHRIAVPALVLHALDDPFIRILPSTREALAGNPRVSLIETARGGHCAFLAPPDGPDGYDGYWAEKTLLDFMLAAWRAS